ncbi:reticulon-like protein B13 [Apium graveolens]|uniref:reticulon-like protein B13 n=1 Tax=Apium graveolens TaxID=4045 RepID=UPI003D7B736E
MTTEFESQPPLTPPHTEAEVVSKHRDDGPVSDKVVTNKTSSSTVRDVLEWRRIDLSLLVLAVATVFYVVLQVYQFNFIPLVSYAAIFIFSSAFIWGNLLRLFGKEGPVISGLEIPEESIRGITYSMKVTGEETVRWMFRVGVEKEWLVFAGSVTALYLLAVVGTHVDFLTFLYTGTVAGMTAPLVYKRYGHVIKEHCWRAREQGNRVYAMVDDKVIRKIKDKTVGHQQTKQHKTE